MFERSVVSCSIREKSCSSAAAPGARVAAETALFEHGLHLTLVAWLRAIARHAREVAAVAATNGTSLKVAASCPAWIER
jgi:hypothetical protein